MTARHPSLAGRLFSGDNARTAGAMVLDVLVIALAYAAALMLRFDAEVPHRNLEFVLRVFPLLALVYITANVVFGVYRTVWTYGSLGDILNLFMPVLISTALIFGVNFWVKERDLPLSVILIAGELIFPGMAFVKMRGRLLTRLPRAAVASQRLLIIGAGHTGQALARQLQNSPGLNYQPIGYLDDDPRKQNRRMHGLRVFGPVSELELRISEHAVGAVAIAIPRASGPVIRSIVGICQSNAVPVRIVPGVERWISSGHTNDALREVTLDDLLGREPVEVDYMACSQSVKDRVVLVTGAAGSIGSELSRQVATFEPLELHLLDNNESGLFDLAAELRSVSHQTTIKLWPANIADGRKIEDVFNQVRPHLVYHAAAYKHVPMLESNPDEAFRANVLGTLNVASAARKFQTGTFVLISTDKAVRPTSIMGATKRIAELLVLALSRHSERTRFVAVRFGNVMGSRGSAPLTFLKQIERGGPVTITHPDMMRYFISIPEAVSLVIQAGTFGGRGNIYMLDMGQEINMLELAERMIRLRGLRPGDDIEVIFTGTRPGEKLREELVADFEMVEPTEHPKVMRLNASAEVSEAEILRLIAEVETVLRQDPEELRRRIHLVARKYSNNAEGVPAGEMEADPAGEPAST
ncbi:MAG: polysaccharide biosynthesis protein [Chloroflexi bacterium]|nr:polysaccharide biosynthesis protein [Chloroflexota bacterium]MCZ7578757.1 polysaccharide biosynthesis protein [Dehalococcoidia bacterium]NJD66992.1 polysaccharide biosynthesis protein [Chloroflexota bacterium]PWB47821.1 MAG: polysaccharide biosynthesis protein [Dehalococcoidia bacterium]